MPQLGFAEHQLEVAQSTLVNDIDKCQYQQQNNLFGNGRKDLGKFFIGATHILSAAAHPTNACSLQMGHHLKGN